MRVPSVTETARQHLAGWQVARIIEADTAKQWASVQSTLTSVQQGRDCHEWRSDTTARGVRAGYGWDARQVIYTWLELFTAVRDRAGAHPDLTADLLAAVRAAQILAAEDAWERDVRVPHAVATRVAYTAEAFALAAFWGAVPDLLDDLDDTAAGAGTPGCSHEGLGREGRRIPRGWHVRQGSNLQPPVLETRARTQPLGRPHRVRPRVWCPPGQGGGRRSGFPRRAGRVARILRPLLVARA